MENKKRPTQKDMNPYKNSDSNKRYQTYDYYTRHQFGGKCAKIPLDCGFTCPNKDGTIGKAGCIYCLEGSKSSKGNSIKEQYNYAKKIAEAKWNVSRFIPYLQANTNTYAPVEQLHKIYTEISNLPGAVMMCIATRADCLGDDVIKELVKISDKIPLTVELGLQTANDKTALIIGRGHNYNEFCDGYTRLRKAGGNISIGIHIINGLPGETQEEMLKTALKVSSLRPDQIKIHLLHVLKGTALHKLYISGEYIPMKRESYVNVTCSQIELMPENTVIARVTGDAPPNILIAPKWCNRKTAVTNEIDKELYRRGTWQGYNA